MSKIPISEPQGESLQNWSKRVQSFHVTRSDMNYLIMNYLETEGFKEAAEKFKVESGVQPSIDLDTMDERIKIREAIQNGEIQTAMALINNLHPELLDNNRYLYFHLQQQHLIELIRNKEVEKALEFAQCHLAEKGEENAEILVELERTLAMLAFENPQTSPFGDLLHTSHRQKVASEVNAAILEEEMHDSSPKLTNLLKLLMWSQQELDNKKIKYPKMSNIEKGTIEDPSTSK